jgi:hypothetical protein
MITLINNDKEKCRRMRQSVSWIGVTLLGVLFLLLPACTRSIRGAETKEEVVDTYLNALERKDEQSILMLIPESHIAEQEVKAKVKQLGGHIFREVRVNYRQEFGLQRAMVTVQGVYSGPLNERVEFREVLNLEYIHGRWYLILGQYRGFPPPVTPPATPPL